jgi:hypothetical protein
MSNWAFCEKQIHRPASEIMPEWAGKGSFAFVERRWMNIRALAGFHPQACAQKLAPLMSLSPTSTTTWSRNEPPALAASTTPTSAVPSEPTSKKETLRGVQKKRKLLISGHDKRVTLSVPGL